ncbi:MAG: phage baseplate assembly protein V [Neisseriales bacterium]|jgi:phage baseplate assembly protein V|nr:MAG: phage baseplate assembly protein V [Neisseriales bacterium]
MIDNNLIREGLVTSINSDYTCDVYFPDQDYTASKLRLLNPGGSRNKDRNLPNPNDLALCVFIPPSLTDGWVIGFGYNDEDNPPAGDENIHSTTYPDGTVISYDSKNHVLTADCNGDVKIVCKTAEVTAEKAIIIAPTTIRGDLTVEGQIKASKDISSGIKVSAPTGAFGSGVVGNKVANGGLTIDGKDWKSHTHSAGSLVAPNGPVTGTTDQGNTS